jgi:hypothetical protein
MKVTAISRFLVWAAAGVTLVSCSGATTTTVAPNLIAAGVLAPPLPSGMQCIYTPDPTAPALSHGLVDCALVQTYEPTLLVGNSGPRAEIQKAVVHVVDAATGAVVADSTVLGSAPEFAAVAQVPSYATVAFTLLNAAAVSHFCPGAAGAAPRTAEVHVTVQGQTLTEQSIQSNELLFSVDVCYGCLVSVPAGVGPGYCAGELPSASDAVACVVGQDQVTDCQSCSREVPYCKALE